MRYTTIRWGILGTGNIAKQFANALKLVPDAVLHAVGSRSVASAQSFGAEFKVPHCYGDYAELAADPDIDVIYIATPHPAHAENAKLCLSAGKAVLCEKPFTMHAQQAREVIALAREKQVFLMEAMWTRYLPGILEAKRLVEADEIGRLHHVQADFGFHAQVGPEHRLLNPVLGGGALLDLGIYPLSVAAFFLGPIASAQAVAELSETGVDTQTAFSMRHISGGVSSCFCSIKAQSPIALTLSGERGNLHIHHPFFSAETLTLTLPDQAPKLIYMPKLGNGYPHEAIEVGRCLRAGLLESPAMPLAETEALMHWMDTMRGQIGLRYPEDD